MSTTVPDSTSAASSGGSAFGILEDVGKTFPASSRGAAEVVALERVTYSFRQGELVSLLGPSGQRQDHAPSDRRRHDQGEQRPRRGARSRGPEGLRGISASCSRRRSAAVALGSRQCAVPEWRSRDTTSASGEEARLELLDLVGAHCLCEKPAASGFPAA